jgi:glycosyltransferase involved in cell wall biosynthesis
MSGASGISAGPSPGAGGVRLSVVIPTFNRGPKTLRAAHSVRAQGVADVEIIVVDDGSDDMLLGELHDVVDKVIRLDRNAGPAEARNRGVASARAPILAFLDSDDVWIRGTLRIRLEAFERRQDPLSCQVSAFASVRSDERIRFRHPHASSRIDAYLGGCWFAPGSTAIMRRETFALVGGFDPVLRRLEDFDWFLRFASIGGRLDIHPLPAAAIERRRFTDPATIISASEYLRRKHAGLIDVTPEGRANFEAYMQLEAASSYLGARSYGAFVSAMARSYLAKPRLTIQTNAFWSPLPDAALAGMDMDQLLADLRL